MAKNNKITIDVIAVMMQKGLAEIHEIMGKIREDLNQKADKADIDLILKTKADKSDIDLVLTRISLLGDKIDENRADQYKLKSQVDKHEKWHHQTAEKIGIKLAD